MAKSLRSKRKRKLRAVKRERYAVKELTQLKGILEKVEKKDIDMSDICTVLPTGAFKDLTSKKTTEIGEGSSGEGALLNSMEVDVQAPKYHPKLLTNEHGNYPVWMNQRKIRKHKEKLGKAHKKGKKNKSR